MSNQTASVTSETTDCRWSYDPSWFYFLRSSTIRWRAAGDERLHLLWLSEININILFSAVAEHGDIIHFCLVSQLLHGLYRITFVAQIHRPLILIAKSFACKPDLAIFRLRGFNR